LVAPQVKDQLHISISPNPVRTSDGVALLTATSKKPLAVIEGTLSIFNIKGQLVYREKIPVNHSKVEHNINLQQFATGIYLCQMSLGDKQATKKLIIIK
ncbi:MAG TPA: T9SS type A sorting domain-containing protein, partial [Candidatus Cloacimonetes bacterium]|nr:T9SS type A sorting domain-containing protein [Candidatus Cloacimonadota bacterium]